MSQPLRELGAQVLIRYAVVGLWVFSIFLVIISPLSYLGPKQRFQKMAISAGQREGGYG